MSRYEWLFFPPERRRNPILHHQAGLTMHRGEAEQGLCRTYTDSAAHPTEDNSTDIVLLPWHEGWRCSRVASSYGSTDVLSTAERSAAITSLRRGKITQVTEWGGSWTISPRSNTHGVHQQKHNSHFFSRNRLAFRQLCKHNGGFVTEIEVNETFASDF